MGNMSMGIALVFNASIPRAQDKLESGQVIEAKNEILGNAENTNDDETQEEIAKVQSIVLQIIFLGDFTL